MLSEALQRNAKHEARLSNISVYLPLRSIQVFDPRFFASLRMTLREGFKEVEASVCSPTTEQAFVSERNTEYRPRLHTTTGAREPPTTTLACTHSEIAKKRATQRSQLQRAKGIAS